MSSENFVDVNIGGSVFNVNRGTLIKVDLFKTVLGTDAPVSKDEFGRVFIDRSPLHFERIVYFVHDGHVALPGSQQNILEIRKEAQYYQLDGLVKLCYKKIPEDVLEMIEKSERKCLGGKAKGSTVNDIVHLDIGGTFFRTTKSTLTKFNGFFKTMFDTGIPVTTDVSGCIIINRNPKHFETILNYMRDGHVAFPYSLNSEIQENIQKIQQEAEYYLLNDLVKLCNEQIPIKLTDGLSIIKNEHYIRTLARTNTYAPVLVIDYFTDSAERTLPSTVAKFYNFAVNYSRQFNIIFKPFQADHDHHYFPSNGYRIFGWSGVVGSGDFDDVDNGIEMYIEKKNKMYRREAEQYLRDRNKEIQQKRRYY